MIRLLQIIGFALVIVGFYISETTTQLVYCFITAFGCLVALIATNKYMDTVTINLDGIDKKALARRTFFGPLILGGLLIFSYFNHSHKYSSAKNIINLINSGIIFFFTSIFMVNRSKATLKKLEEKSDVQNGGLEQHKSEGFKPGSFIWSWSQMVLQLNATQKKDLGNSYKSPFLIFYFVVLILGYIFFKYYPPLQSSRFLNLKFSLILAAMGGYLLVQSDQIKRMENSSLPIEMIKYKKRNRKILRVVLVIIIVGIGVGFYLSHRYLFGN